MGHPCDELIKAFTGVTKAGTEVKDAEDTDSFFGGGHLPTPLLHVGFVRLVTAGLLRKHNFIALARAHLIVNSYLVLGIHILKSKKMNNSKKAE